MLKVGSIYTHLFWVEIHVTDGTLLITNGVAHARYMTQRIHEFTKRWCLYSQDLTTGLLTWQFVRQCCTLLDACLSPLCDVSFCPAYPWRFRASWLCYTQIHPSDRPRGKLLTAHLPPETRAAPGNVLSNSQTWSEFRVLSIRPIMIMSNI